MSESKILTSEQRQRIAEIEARQPSRAEWQYGKDIDFLLSIVKGQEVETLHYFKAGKDGRCVTCGYLRLWQYHVDEENDPATLMRSLCVEKVKSMRDENRRNYEYWKSISSNPDTDFGVLKWAAWAGEDDRIIKELESLSIQEQKSSSCGAPRPDDGSECLYGVCPRPRDGCSEYCWQHHGTQCVVQEQEAKQS